MYKKILSFVLAVLMVASIGVVSVAAEEVAPTETKIYFQVPEDWSGVTRVYCHIWGYNGEKFNSWQSKKEVCTDAGNGLWSYDPINKGKITLEDGVWYGCIFSATDKDNNTVNQTYDALFTTECYGETLYCDGTLYENLEDSTKTCVGAFWTNMDKEIYGPIMGISSIGNVVGTSFKPGDTAESLFSSFLLNRLESARKYSNKDDQAIIDDIADGLRIDSDDMVCQIIVDYMVATGNTVAWVGAEGQVPTIPSTGDESTPDESTPEESTPDESTPDESNPGTEDPDKLMGDADGNGKVNVKDVTEIQKHAANIIQISEDKLALADVNGDGKVNVKDATAIQKWIAGITPDSIIGTPLAQ